MGILAPVISTSGDEHEVAKLVRRLNADFRSDGGCWFRGVGVDSQQETLDYPLRTWVPRTAVVRAYFDQEGPHDFGRPDEWVQ